jgi:TonB family protein
MRRVFLALLTSLVLFSGASRAQDTTARACDLAAASPEDQTRPANIAGIRVDQIDPGVAMPACEAALAADPQKPRLLFQMGRVFEAERDDAQARIYYEKAAAYSYAAAQNSLGALYLDGRGGLSKDDTKAVQLFKLAADQGSAIAQFNLAASYAWGRGGLQKSDERAVQLLKLAADQGELHAQAGLGVAYINGVGGLQKDDQKAVTLLKLAVNQGSAVGQFNLGFFYETGRGGLVKNEAEAARLYKLAADQGEPHALVHLAGYYAAGRGGLQKNASEASRLCNLAAAKDPVIANAGPQCSVRVPPWAQEYSMRVAQILDQHRRYPAKALLTREQGTVIVDFVIDRQGRLADRHVRQSSGSTVLDNEALSILQQSQPFPAFPDNAPEQSISLSAPIQFHIP